MRFKKITALLLAAALAAGSLTACQWWEEEEDKPGSGGGAIVNPQPDEGGGNEGGGNEGGGNEGGGSEGGGSEGGGNEGGGSEGGGNEGGGDESDNSEAMKPLDIKEVKKDFYYANGVSGITYTEGENGSNALTQEMETIVLSSKSKDLNVGEATGKTTLILDTYKVKAYVPVETLEKSKDRTWVDFHQEERNEEGELLKKGLHATNSIETVNKYVAFLCRQILQKAGAPENATRISFDLSAKLVKSKDGVSYWVVGVVLSPAVN